MNSFIPSIQELREMLHLASNRATWVFFAIPIFLLLGIGVLADRATSSFAQSEYWVSHTHEMREKIESLRAELFLAQDSRKGYVHTGNGDGLAGYTAALEQVPILTKELRQLTADNKRQQARVEQLDSVIQHKLSLLQQS